MARFIQCTPVGSDSRLPIGGDGPYYLDLDSIIMANFTPGRDPIEGGSFTDLYPKVVLYTSTPGLPVVTIKDAAAVDTIRKFIEGRSHC